MNINSTSLSCPHVLLASWPDAEHQAADKPTRHRGVARAADSEHRIVRAALSSARTKGGVHAAWRTSGVEALRGSAERAQVRWVALSARPIFGNSARDFHFAADSYPLETFSELSQCLPVPSLPSSHHHPGHHLNPLRRRWPTLRPSPRHPPPLPSLSAVNAPCLSPRHRPAKLPAQAFNAPAPTCLWKTCRLP